MELDNLKSIWKEQGQPAQHTVSNEDLSEILKKNSKHPIAKIKRNVLLELIVLVVSYTAMIIFFYSKDNGLYIVQSMFIATFLVIGLVYYCRKIILLNKMLNNTDQIRVNLIKHLDLLKKYVRFYYIFGTILGPLVYVFTYLIIITSQGKLNTPELSYWEIIKNADTLWHFFITGTIVLILSPIFNKYYVRKLYGDHVKTIENLVKQVDD